jgi:NarL family two-component system response regulator LiaR
VAALAAIRRLRPDVVLLDMMMPVLDGLGVLHALQSEDERPVVIVLTSFLDDERAIDAVRAGALSYLPKTAGADRVTEAVRAAATGGNVLDAGVAGVLVPRLRDSDRDGPLRRLSAREREVLVELSRGVPTVRSLVRCHWVTVAGVSRR